MAVVVNDFEVVNEPAQGGARGASGEGAEQGGSGGASAPAAPTPNEMRRILRRELERMERICAH